LDERLRDLAVPTLVVFGTEDRALNPKAAAAYAAATPKAQVLLMQGIGHVPMVEAPALAAESYLKFRAGLAAREG
jgi:pimeloyl-ACP methyl ester carboxylesterase